MKTTFEFLKTLLVATLLALYPMTTRAETTSSETPKDREAVENSPPSPDTDSPAPEPGDPGERPPQTDSDAEPAASETAPDDTPSTTKPAETTPASDTEPPVRESEEDKPTADNKEEEVTAVEPEEGPPPRKREPPPAGAPPHFELNTLGEETRSAEELRRHQLLQNWGHGLLGSGLALVLAGIAMVEADPWGDVGVSGFSIVGGGIAHLTAGMFCLGFSRPVHLREKSDPSSASKERTARRWSVSYIGYF